MRSRRLLFWFTTISSFLESELIRVTTRPEVLAAESQSISASDSESTIDQPGALTSSSRRNWFISAEGTNVQNLSLLLEQLLPGERAGWATQWVEDLSELGTLVWRLLFGSIEDRQPLLPDLRPEIYGIEAHNPKLKEQPIVVRPWLRMSQISTIC